MLIKSLEDIKEILPVSDAVNLDRLRPHLETAEQTYLKPLLGELYNSLESFTGETIPENLQEHETQFRELLKLVHRSEVHLAYWSGYDVLNAYISDGGFRRIETDKVKGLFKYQEDSLKDYFKSTGFNSLDAVLDYIESNIVHFKVFKDSESWKFLKGAFIPDTKTFNSIYFIGSSRLIFMRLQPYVKVVEDLSIRQIINQENMDFIKAEMLKDEPDPKVSAILPLIRKPVAFLAVAMLMEDSGADLTDKGLFFEGRGLTMLSDTVKSPAEIERVQNLVKRNKGLGESYLLQLKQYLNENADAWGGYQLPRQGLHNRDNSGKRTFWV